MGEENWPEGVVRSKGGVKSDDWSAGRQGWDVLSDVLGGFVSDGPRPALCADCGVVPADGLLIHLKPETYRVFHERGGRTEELYLERHIGVSCGCAAKRGLI